MKLAGSVEAAIAEAAGNGDLIEGVDAIRIAMVEVGLGSYSRDTVYRYCRRQRIPAWKVGHVWNSTYSALRGKRSALENATS